MGILPRREYIEQEYNRIVEAKKEYTNEEIDLAYEIAWRRKASYFITFDLEEARKKLS